MLRRIVSHVLALAPSAILMVSCRSATRNDMQVIWPSEVSEIPGDAELSFSNPAWHPSGEYIALEGQNPCIGNCSTGVFGLDPVSGDVWDLLEGEFNQSSPSWSPNGELLSFSWSGPGQSGTFVKDLGTGLSRYLLDGYDAEWSADGSQVAFVREQVVREGESRLEVAELGVLNINTSEETILFEAPASDFALVRGLSWSPTGQMILFAIRIVVDGTDHDILYSLALGTDAPEVVSETLPGVHSPGWMLGGDWIYFVYGSDDRLSFARLSDGCIVDTEIIQIESLDLSPDGDSMVFTSQGKVLLLDVRELVGAHNQLLTCGG